MRWLCWGACRLSRECRALREVCHVLLPQFLWFLAQGKDPQRVAQFFDPYELLSAAAQNASSVIKKYLRLQAAAAGVFDISFVLKRGCIVGRALDLETSLLNEWCVVLLLAAMLQRPHKWA